MAEHGDSRTSYTTRAVALAAVVLFAAAIQGRARADDLAYGDGMPDGKRSFGGGGHLVMFDAGAEGRWLNAVRMYGSRYGSATPPDEDFHLYVVDSFGVVLRDVSLPYSLWECGDDYWRELPIPPIEVPQQFGIGLTFNAHQTKGVYVGLENVTESHSYSWLPGADAEPMWESDWAVVATVEDAPVGDPKATDLVVLNGGEASFDVVPSMGEDPTKIETAIHGTLAAEDVASVRLHAAVEPGAAAAVVLLASGRRIDAQTVEMDGEAVKVRDAAGADWSFPRAEVVRVDFPVVEVHPIVPHADLIREGAAQ
jgi:hypothetical protein